MGHLEPKKREVLVRTQVSDVNSCANGSWNPAKDAWGKQGGRLVITSLSVLPLQVYYHWIPIMRPFKADEEAVPERETKPEENRTIKPAKKTPRKFKVREKGDVEDSLPTDSGMDAEKEKKAREKEDADHRILESKPGDAVPADPVGPPRRIPTLRRRLFRRRNPQTILTTIHSVEKRQIWSAVASHRFS